MDFGRQEFSLGLRGKAETFSSSRAVSWLRCAENPHLNHPNPLPPGEGALQLLAAFENRLRPPARERVEQRPPIIISPHEDSPFVRDDLDPMRHEHALRITRLTMTDLPLRREMPASSEGAVVRRDGAARRGDAAVTAAGQAGALGATLRQSASGPQVVACFRALRRLPERDSHPLVKCSVTPPPSRSVALPSALSLHDAPWGKRRRGRAEPLAAKALSMSSRILVARASGRLQRMSEVGSRRGWWARRGKVGDGRRRSRCCTRPSGEGGRSLRARCLRG